MNRFVNFLLDLRRLILLLNNNRTLTNGIILKEFILDNVEFLDNTTETINFIDAIYYLCEDFDAGNVDSLYKIGCAFYFSILSNNIIDVYFLGSQQSFTDFKSRINKSNINLIFYDVRTYSFVENNILKMLPKSKISVMAYDYSGSNIFLYGGCGTPFSYYLYEPTKNNTSESKGERSQQLCEFLCYQHSRLNKINVKTLIFGSSYSYFALTDIHSKNSLSISIPGLDITNTQDLFFNIADDNPATKNIFCFGYYDLFKEIKYGTAFTYVKARSALSKFKETHLKESNQNIDYNLTLDDSVDNIISTLYFIKPEEKSKKISANITCVQDEIFSEDYLAEDENYLSGENIVSTHNKYIKYTHSFSLNCDTMLSIKEYVTIRKQDSYLLIPPVSKGYLENLDARIKEKATRFFETLESEYFHVIDLSNDKDFLYTDFIDGHHLNSNGAKKLQQKLFEAGILCHSQL
ncbi:hypothetical protein [Kluyvera georgiana]|uniref:hypothetical protein n=1 Tax=Kluyvera georgiana TaxID=73098 RepID=UPI00322098F3